MLPRPAPTATTTSRTRTGTPWARLLADEELHVAGQGFGAGVIVCNYAPELVKRVDDESRAVVESAVVALIEKKLGWTDRTAIVAPGRLGIVTVPVDGTMALAARAREINDDLRGRGVSVDVAFALRRTRGGLQAAAARADAALDTASARRRAKP